MESENFVHLHVHSEYSLLDGACKIDDLVSAASNHGMPSVALTDHGNMFGAIEFYKKAKKKGIKPILGFEAYVTAKSMREKGSGKDSKEKLSHLTLLAENNEGYQNLLKLTTAAYLEGFYYKPRLDKEILNNHSKGIICLSGCMSSEFNQHLLKGNRDSAVHSIKEYSEIFGKDNFFLELQDNDIENQKELVLTGKELGDELGIPLVASNDVHYMNAEDAMVQDVLLCINTRKKFADTDRMRFSSKEFFFKTAEQMAMNFSKVPEALTNTLAISDRCNISLEFGKIHLPRFTLNENLPIYQKGMTNLEFLRKLCESGIERLYETSNSTIKERLDHELKVIEDTGFVDYFLIVWDFISYAVKNRIQASGRGSGAGSIVAFTLGITNIDPIANDLLFERFLNAGRVSMPDLDIDFCAEGRDKIIEYVKKKYGGDRNVAQIITFGRMKAKAVIRDVGRVLDVPLSEVNTIAKLVPPALDITLKEALEQEPQLQAMYDENAHIKRLFDISSRLEGQCRHISTHAAGIVISDKPLTDYLPLAKNGDAVVTQFDMNTVADDIGMLKADFLGLRKITVIVKAVDLIKETTGNDIDIAKIPMDDKKTYGLLSRGEVKGVFQVETSRGIKELLMKLKPEHFGDILPLIALYRPGPLQSGMVDTFVKCRHGKEEVKYLHPMLEPILKETYGVILYQEQVMRIANRLANFTLNEADDLRKAMGKKKDEIMAKYKDQFVVGAVKNSVPENIAEKIFELMRHFAGYGFNKSHSAAYAVITYQTAYLKANYPTQYMVAQLNCEKSNNDKIVGYMSECNRMGIEVLQPCINESTADFTMIEEKKMRFGLGAIKNVGEKAIKSIIKERAKGKFKSIFDFCTKVDLRLVNKQVIESLVKSGSLDALPGHRAQLIHGLEDILQIANLHSNDRNNRQMTFFDDEAHADLLLPEIQKLPDVPEWSEMEILNAEKESVGFFVSSNPLERYEDVLSLYTKASTSSLNDLSEGDDVVLGGIVTEIKKTTTKKGDPMAYVTLEDFEGMCVCVIFSRELEKYNDFIKANEVIFVKGQIGFRNEIPSIRIKEVIPVSEAHKKFCGSVTITIDESHFNESLLLQLRDTINDNRGKSPLSLEMVTPDEDHVKIDVGKRFYISVTDKLQSEVENMLGPEHLSIKPIWNNN
ncbi:MAG: DNA polymerase III subunit alpha [Candidatus Anammoxibacter sp.]